MRMNRQCMAAVASVALFVTGCNSQTPGGSGVTDSSRTGTATSTSNKPVIGDADATFNVSAPSLATRVKQGESVTATIGVSRGKNFNDDVALKVVELPVGVTVDPPVPMIKRADKETTLTFQAAPEAAVGEYTIKLVGHPTTGADATSTMKLTVLAK